MTTSARTYTTFRDSIAENPEPMALGIEQHLVGLKKIGPNQKGPSVRQLDMRNLQLGALAAEDGKVLAPVELERLAGTESQLLR